MGEIIICFPNIHFFFFFIIFFTIFSSSSSSSSSAAAYTLPQRFFINCGSNSSTTFNNRTFVPDESSVGDEGGSVFDRDNNLSPVYQTARVFKKPSFYELETKQTGLYILRLHFYAFPSHNLTKSCFDVVVLGLRILSNFSVQRNKIAVIEEFLLWVNENKFRIQFIPSKGSSLAFVNAIETFLAPENLIPETGDSIRRNVLRVVHRINVGGDGIEPGNDTLLRKWVPDDEFLFSKGMAKNVTSYRKRPDYSVSGATEFDAPDYVYQTAKQSIDLDRSNIGDASFNVTWSFDVEKNRAHFVRVHFCDIVNGTIMFNLYVNGEVKKLIKGTSPASPFFHDFIVNSDSSGSMNVTIGGLNDDMITTQLPNQTAFLNGVEIMQLIKDQDSGESTKQVFVVIIVVVVGSVVMFLLGIAVFFCFVSRKRKRGESKARGAICMSPDKNFELRVPLSEILLATDNFDPKNVIGEGGFGKVFRGVLQNGSKVAVKRSDPGRGQGLREFQAEITALSRIHYRHLVSLIGYCTEKDEMILMYEFMEKGTLRDHLYDLESSSPGSSSGSPSFLSWDQRLEICIGAAKGLHYLHTELEGAIIHRDIKSANILLDENYVAKVADFGLSRSGPWDLSHVSTDVKGSFGYLDPEYFKTLQLTQKSDVYSFGVVLLEVLCARPAIDTSLPRDEVSLADWGVSWVKKNELERIVDPLISGRIDPDSLRRFGEIVEKCLREHGVDRPNMVDVVWDLKYALQLQQSSMMSRDSQVDDDDQSRAGYSWPVFHRLPSHVLPVAFDKDDGGDDDDMSQPLTDSLVFSQLRINDGR